MTAQIVEQELMRFLKKFMITSMHVFDKMISRYQRMRKLYIIFTNNSMVFGEKKCYQ
jgi:hypothetical protein